MLSCRGERSLEPIKSAKIIEIVCFPRAHKAEKFFRQVQDQVDLHKQFTVAQPSDQLGKSWESWIVLRALL